MTHAHDAILENKALGPDAAQAMGELNRAFEALRATNDERLGQIEARAGADAVTEEKLARIGQGLETAQRRLDELALKAARPMLGAPLGPAQSGEAREHKAAFDLYVRAGETGGLKGLEAKALQAGSGPDGGYLVPVEAEREILRRMALVSPIRQAATVRTIATASYRKAVPVSGFSAGWVGETAARPVTDTGALTEIAFPAMELYAMPAATQTILDDAAVDVEQWIAEEVEGAFAEQESAAFIKGDGVNRPLGILSAARAAEVGRPSGKLGVIATGAAAAFPLDDPSDKLLDLVYALKSGYRAGASFVMNRRTLGVIRKFKDAQGGYLWQPAAGAGAPSTLMGFPVIEAEDMPDVGPGAHAIAFGDLRRGYLVVDRQGVRVLRDPYSAKPYVLFYTTKRVGGGVQDFDAIKLLAFQA